MDFYLYRDGQQLGPYSIEALQDMLRLGSISASDLAWCDGLTNWTPLANLLPDSPDAAAAASPPSSSAMQAVGTITLRGAGAAREAPASGATGDSSARAPLSARGARRLTPALSPATLNEQSYLQLLTGSLGYPFKRDGLMLLAGGTLFFLVTGFLSSFSIIIAVFAGGYLAAYQQKIITSSAHGDEELPSWPDVSQFWEDVLSPYLQFLGTALICFGPAVFGFFRARSAPELAPLGYGLLGLGLIYWPMSWLAVSMYDTLAALNPLLVVRSICRVPTDYLVTCLVLAGLFGLQFGVEFMSGLAPVPLLSRLVTGFVSLYLLTVAMRILGLLYFANRFRLGWFERA